MILTKCKLILSLAAYNKQKEYYVKKNEKLKGKTED